MSLLNKFKDMAFGNVDPVQSARNAQSLDASSIAIMMADENRVITYVNQAVKTLLKDAESDIREVLPQFSADNLLGQSIDQFHRNPSHQQNMLANLTRTQISQIKVGKLTFKLTVNPLFDDNRKSIGSVVEWHNMTPLIEAEVVSLRMLGALDGTSTNVMIADTQRNIIYMNKSVEAMLRNVEGDLRRELPNFSVDKILNNSMDVFHKNPSHQATLLDTLNQTYEAKIAVGRLQFRLIANPIFDNDKNRLGTVVEWLDITEEMEQKHKIARVVSALDGTSTNVMIADPDGDIVYLNNSVESMLRNVESDLRKVLPHFDVNKVLGSNFDVFHKDPSHQRNLLARIQSPYTSHIKVGELHFRLVASPIFDDKNERIGTVVEWLDRSAEVAAEEEISKIVNAASDGDFTVRAKTEGKEGFMLNMAEGLNTLISTTESGLNDLARVLNAVADGNMTETVTNEYKGTFALLQNYSNTTTENLSRMISDIRQAADVIRSASSEISMGNSDLSNRTEEQASSLEETASSMEELTGTVRLNAENASQANGLASAASTVAIDGGNLIQQVVETMSSINESARKISDIIGVIDGIAFQTNILALNAAVEAARAGEQGRGFAVVASEVRSLAQRSADAAKDIKVLISDSVTKIESGNQLVNESGDTMEKVVNSIKRVNDIMAEIAAASAEQASGIDEVSKAVTQMDEVTQQNASLVEEAAAASESLQSQAEQLADMVSTFKLDERFVTEASTPTANKQLSNQVTVGSKNQNLQVQKANITPSLPAEDEWENF